MRVLVTGSSGRLGRELVLLLAGSGYAVVGADLVPAATTHRLLDVRDAAAVRQAVQGCEAVIHTAALHGRHLDLAAPRRDFLRTNVEGTLNLLEACCGHGISKFLYTSTTSIYGQAMVQADAAVWVTENLVPQPRDIYDISKQAAEALCRDFFDRERLEATVLRVGRFLPEPTNLAANHRLYRGLDERDGALAHLLALRHRFTSFEVFNVAAGSPFEPIDTTALKHDPGLIIERRLPGVTEAYRQLNWQLPTSIDRVYSIEKARRVLGYQPRYTAEYLLREALRQASPTSPAFPQP